MDIHFEHRFELRILCPISVEIGHFNFLQPPAAVLVHDGWLLNRSWGCYNDVVDWHCWLLRWELPLKCVGGIHELELCVPLTLLEFFDLLIYCVAARHSFIFFNDGRIG